MSFRQVELVSPTESQLEEYVGVYSSDEVPARYKVVLEEGKLALEVGADTDKFPMRTNVQDGFGVKGILLKFARDDRGRVIGFDFQGSGIWNLRFVRDR